jgi:hypothetical protein
MANDRRSCVPNRTYNEMKNDLQDFQKIFSQIANANRFFNERMGKGTEASAPHRNAAQELSTWQ